MIFSFFKVAFVNSFDGALYSDKDDDVLKRVLHISKYLVLKYL